LLPESIAIRRSVLLVVDGELHVPLVYGQSEDPIQLRRIEDVAGLPVSQHIHIAIQHNLVLIEVKAGMHNAWLPNS